MEWILVTAWICFAVYSLILWCSNNKSTKNDKIYMIEK